MRVLVLSTDTREPDFSYVYNRLSLLVDLDVRKLDKSEQRDLKKYICSVELPMYDRVLLDLRFSNIYRQSGFLRHIPGLLIYEEDACQNYLENSRWYGRFSRFYQALPNAKMVVTGFDVAERLKAEGLSVHFVPKGYNPKIVFCEGLERDIELGFIGRTASKVYKGRKQLLDQLVIEVDLQLIRTDPGADYRRMLNRIRYFVSADIGLNEYMAKNFEAMACGCVLLAWRQGREETALGLQEGTHMLLYSSLEELREHLTRLRESPELASALAERGRVFAEQHLTHGHLAERLAALLEGAWPSVKPRSFWDALYNKLKIL